MDIEKLLKETTEDRRLSRGEGQALREVLRDEATDRRKIADIRTRAFRLARDAADGSGNAEVLEWLAEVVRILFSVTNENLKGSHCEAAFSPGPDCVGRIAGLFRGARRTADVAVYTITDDELVLTGSYNWTRSAADENAENIVVSDDPRLLGAFRGEFDRLWARFS